MKRRISLAATMAALAVLLMGNSAFAVTETSNALSDKPVVKAAKSYEEILNFIEKSTPNWDEVGRYEIEESTIEEVEEVEEVEELLAVGDPITSTNDSVAETPAAERPSANPSDYSQTNVQTQGVDESDIIKTDGKYIYYMRPVSSGYRFSIVETSTSGKMKEILSKSFVSSTGGRLHDSEMYITPTKAVLLFSETKSDAREEPQTTAMIYDIANKSKVTLFRKFMMTGSKKTSRMIGEQLYLSTGEWYYPGANSKPTVANLPAYGDGALSTVPATDIYYMPDYFTRSFLTVAGLNVNDKKPASVKSIMADVNSTSMYASTTNMYFPCYQNHSGNVATTALLKFNVSGGKVSFISAGAVKGNLLNQFSMDEYNGDLRVATTAYANGTSGNNLYVLNSKMDTVGSLEGLAPTEQIYSVRYDKHMAYMVTYRQTDPLYAIDVSDPKNPVVKGFLKIPGYSSYMHPVGDNLMVGIGQNADANGSVMGVKLSLFDVSNPDLPKELHVLTLGGVGSSSAAEKDHKTLLYDSARQVMCFPVHLNNMTSANTPTVIKPMYPNSLVGVFDGFVVVEVDKKTGFKVAGTVPTSPYEKPRGVRIGDVLYVISGDTIVSTSMVNYKMIDELKLK